MHKPNVSIKGWVTILAVGTTLLPLRAGWSPQLASTQAFIQPAKTKFILFEHRLENSESISQAKILNGIPKLPSIVVPEYSTFFL